MQALNANAQLAGFFLKAKENNKCQSLIKYNSIIYSLKGQMLE